ncbi:EamA family transporter [Zhihengliuella sp.]|uniref:EamA family transporter n=1 Tax=Zhihengliuella sp. TaxID=1954483 RepID=UPI0028121A71|nr:EamA family transporter [Zhihengliuella sp.]
MTSIYSPAVLLVLVSLFCQQLGASIAVTIYPEVMAQGVVAMRFGFAALLLLLFTRPRWSTFRSMDRAAWTAVAGLGLTMAAMNSLIYEAFGRIPQGVAVTLEVLGPLALSVIAGRRLIGLLWAGLSLTGIVILGRDGFDAADGLDPVGVLCALGAAACWAGFILTNQRAGRHLPGVQGLAIAMVIGSLGTVPIGFATAGTALLRPEVLAIGVGIAILSSALPYGIEMHTLRTLPASLFAMITCLSPVVAALSALVVLHQQLELPDLVAMLLVVAACLGAVRSSNRPAHPA